jgi:hypothetical protein
VRVGYMKDELWRLLLIFMLMSRLRRQHGYVRRPRSIAHRDISDGTQILNIDFNPLSSSAEMTAGRPGHVGTRGGVSTRPAPLSALAFRQLGRLILLCMIIRYCTVVYVCLCLL